MLDKIIRIITVNATLGYFLPSEIKKALFCIFDLQRKQLKGIEISGREAGAITIYGSEFQPSMY
jgi:hypothetical protein